MTYKQVLAGPWLQTATWIDFYKAQMLMTYPEQFRAYFVDRTLTPDIQTELLEELVLSMWTGVEPWWARLDYPDRRTKDYKTAADSVRASGLVPMLAHELDTAGQMLTHLATLGFKHPQLVTAKFQAHGLWFGDQVLVDGKQVFLFKIASFNDIDRRCWTSDWPGQLAYAAWLRSDMEQQVVDVGGSGVVVLDTDLPGRATIVRFDETPWIVKPAQAAKHLAAQVMKNSPLTTRLRVPDFHKAKVDA